MNYDILKIRLEGVPKIPYTDGIGKHRGICMHATANWGSGSTEDTAMNERNWEQNNWESAFVHYFCDYSMILDIADDDYISYGCGSAGNKLFINAELCQTKDKKRFIESYNRWIYIAAKVLYDNKLGVIDGVTLVSHKWVSDNLGGSHQDPISYLAYHGKVWTDVVRDVTNYYKTFEQESIKPVQAEDEEQMKLTDDQWKRLGDSLSGLFDKGILNDKTWAVKAYSKELTLSESTYLNLVISARQAKVKV